MKAIDKVLAMDPCSEAAKWLKTQRKPQEAWDRCQRGDWMLWLLGQLDADRKLIVLAACDCAELSLHLVQEEEDRPRNAIETARAWVRGEATIEQVRAASDAAYAYAAASEATYASAAAYAASDASYASDAAYAYAAASDATYASAASYASDATYASASAADATSASDTAYAAASDAARAETLAQCADIVRRHFPVQPLRRDPAGEVDDE